jgi:N-methylhydantoinase A/oxoprolinase/acetone carboxylase beta subunit
MTHTIGIDIGGTFPDVVAAAPDGAIILARASADPLADGSAGMARAALAPGQALAGPAIVESDTTTMLPPPGDPAPVVRQRRLDITLATAPR